MGNGGGKSRTVENGGGPSFNKFRMSGKGPAGFRMRGWCGCGRPLYRPSCVSGNPVADGQQRAGLFSTVLDSRLRGKDGRGGRKDGREGGHFGIPAYAGRTVGAAITVLYRYKNPVYPCLNPSPPGPAAAASLTAISCLDREREPAVAWQTARQSMLRSSSGASGRTLFRK